MVFAATLPRIGFKLMCMLFECVYYIIQSCWNQGLWLDFFPNFETHNSEWKLWYCCVSGWDFNYRQWQVMNVGNSFKQQSLPLCSLFPINWLKHPLTCHTLQVKDGLKLVVRGGRVNNTRNSAFIKSWSLWAGLVYASKGQPDIRLAQQNDWISSTWMM